MFLNSYERFHMRETKNDFFCFFEADERKIWKWER